MTVDDGVKHYRVTMRHDNGTVDLDVVSYNFQLAAEAVCRAEGAPLRSVIAVRRVER